MTASPAPRNARALQLPVVHGIRRNRVCGHELAERPRRRQRLADGEQGEARVVTSLEEILDFCRAVPKRIHANANAFKQREMKVRQIRPFFVPDVPPSLQSCCGASGH